MSKPADIILAHRAALKERDALLAAAEQAVDAYARTFGQIAHHVREFERLCRTHGRLNLLVAMPAELRGPFDASLAALRTLWEGQSSAPFPSLPDEPDA